MLKVLFSFIFKLISKLVELILSPIIALLTALIPELGDTLNAFSTIIQTGIESVPFWCQFLYIPLGAVSVFFSYLLLKNTFWLGYRSVMFVIEAYKKFKP